MSEGEWHWFAVVSTIKLWQGAAYNVMRISRGPENKIPQPSRPALRGIVVLILGRVLAGGGPFE